MTHTVEVRHSPDPPELWELFVDGERLAQYESEEVANAAAAAYRASLNVGVQSG